MRGIVGIKVYGNPSFPEVEIQVCERYRFGNGIFQCLQGGLRPCVFRMLQKVLSDTLRCGDHIARYEFLGNFILSLQRIVVNPAVQFGEQLFFGDVRKQREHILDVYRSEFIE